MLRKGHVLGPGCDRNGVHLGSTVLTNSPVKVISYMLKTSLPTEGAWASDLINPLVNGPPRHFGEFKKAQKSEKYIVT